MFNKFKSQGSSDVQKSEDRLGGSQVFATGMYKALIKMLYFTESEGGAGFANIKLEIDGKDYSERFLISNKKGENFWTKDGKSSFFDGFLTLDAICLMTTEEDFSSLLNDIEEKSVKVWNSETRSEVNTEVPVLMPVIGQTIDVLLVHKKANKQKKNNDGVYENINEAREFNEIVKVLADDGRTVNEITDEMQEAVFAPKWLERWDGKVMDTFKEVEGTGTSGRPSPNKAGGGKGRSSSMFNKKR